MAISYTICKVDKFLNKEGFTYHTQYTMDGTEDLPESSYKLSEINFMNVEYKNEPLNIAKYECYQDVKHNKHGKQYGRVFHWYLEPNEFSMFYVEKLEILIFATGRNTVDAFLSQMAQDKNSGLKCSKLEVDFKKIEPLLPMITGAWFAELQKKKQYLKSAGYFGTSVNKSEEFRDAAEAGVISSLFFNYLFHGQDLFLEITKNGAIVLFSRIKNQVTKNIDVSSEISLVLEIYKKYLSTN